MFGYVHSVLHVIPIILIYAFKDMDVVSCERCVLPSCIPLRTWQYRSEEGQVWQEMYDMGRPS